MTLSPFEPARHGFHFANWFVNHFVFGPLKLTSGGRCGGMSYVALDYYFASQPVPEMKDLPESSTTLGKLIVRRQVHSLLNQLPGFVSGMANPFGLRSRSLFLRCLPGGTMNTQLRRFIDAGKPVPIGLVAPKLGVADTHHQAVAVGYEQPGLDPESFRVIFYDPNHPDQPVKMIPDLANNQFRTELPDGGASRSWRTFFVDSRYHPQRIPQESFDLSPWLTMFLRE
jgi:hypothetical protein